MCERKIEAKNHTYVCISNTPTQKTRFKEVCAIGHYQTGVLVEYYAYVLLVSCCAMCIDKKPTKQKNLIYQQHRGQSLVRTMHLHFCRPGNKYLRVPAFTRTIH